jgi:hypothetical protein
MENDFPCLCFYNIFRSVGTNRKLPWGRAAQGGAQEEVASFVQCPSLLQPFPQPPPHSHAVVKIRQRLWNTISVRKKHLTKGTRWSGGRKQTSELCLPVTLAVDNSSVRSPLSCLSCLPGPTRAKPPGPKPLVAFFFSVEYFLRFIFLRL